MLWGTRRLNQAPLRCQVTVRGSVTRVKVSEPRVWRPVTRDHRPQMSEQPEQNREELRGTTKRNTRVTASVTPQPPTPPHGPTTERTQREDGTRTREARNNQTSHKIIEFRT